MQDTPSLGSGKIPFHELPKADAEKSGSSRLPSKTPETDAKIADVVAELSDSDALFDMPAFDFGSANIEMLENLADEQAMLQAFATTGSDASPTSDADTSHAESAAQANATKSKQLFDDVIVKGSLKKENETASVSSMNVFGKHDTSSSVKAHLLISEILRYDAIECFTLLNSLHDLNGPCKPIEKMSHGEILNHISTTKFDPKNRIIIAKDRVTEEEKKKWVGKYGTDIQFIALGEENWNKLIHKFTLSLIKLGLLPQSNDNEENFLERRQSVQVEIQKSNPVDDKTSFKNKEKISRKDEVNLEAIKTKVATSFAIDSELQAKKRKRERIAEEREQRELRKEIEKQERKEEIAKEETVKKSIKKEEGLL